MKVTTNLKTSDNIRKVKKCTRRDRPTQNKEDTSFKNIKISFNTKGTTTYLPSDQNGGNVLNTSWNNDNI